MGYFVKTMLDYYKAYDVFSSKYLRKYYFLLFSIFYLCNYLIL